MANEKTFNFNSEYNIILSCAERLCAMTDKARAYNTYGAFLLTQKASKINICESFKKAFYEISQYETNDIMFYFGVNYIRFMPHTDKDEFNKTSSILLKWCRLNAESIKKKTDDFSIFDKSKSRLIMALYSFSDTLKKREVNQYNHLGEIEHLSQLLTNRISMSKSFYFGNEPIVLF
jgi:hypothetical protein